MKKQIEAADVIETPVAGKRRFFTRQRTHVLKIVEEMVHGEKRHRVTVYQHGKRVRRYFPTEDKAQTFIEQEQTRQRNLGALAKRIDSRMANDAAECETLLKPHGARLLDVCREWTAARATLADFPDVSLEECVRNYAQVLSERAASWTVDRAAEEWLKHIEQDGRSDRYLIDIRTRLSRLREMFGTVCMADMTQDFARAWLDSLGKLSPQSRLNYRTVARSLFSFAVKRKRAPRKPLDEIEMPRVTRAEAGIFTPDELTRLMHHLPADMHAYIALGAFAGIRPAEIMRLDWKDIQLASGTIIVSGSKAKTRRRRTVPIKDNLRAWLAPLAKTEGKVMELGEYVLRKDRIQPAMKAAGITAWPHDVLRHSAATYLLAKEQDEARVALWLGNTPDVLHAHYHSLSTKPEHAEQWFQIMPKKSEGAKIISIQAA